MYSLRVSPRAFIVVNPAAGGGRTGRVWRRLEGPLRTSGLDFTVRETTGPGGATLLARTAADDGWPLVVAVGGDGTLNEVVNGLVDADGRARAALGAILTGRGRDAARNLGLAANPEAAARRLLQGEDVSIDLGRASWPATGAVRWFVNSAGVGFDAEVARRAAAAGGSGTLPYLMSILGALRHYRPVAGVIRHDDGQTWSGAMTMAVVANGPYYGGGMKIAPAADPLDGVLDLVTLGAVGRLELLRWLPSVYRGTHVANAKVTVRRLAEARIDATPPAPVHVDGEAGGTTPVEFAIRPKALRLRR
jgi:YegS/Rv2252/BmrU family lipid kinase